MKNLLDSKVFSRYFSSNHFVDDEGDLIEDFYIMEEQSLFDESIPNIILSHRKLIQFRKLSDFEVVVLAFKSLGHSI